MTPETNASLERLLPCPFCGAGETHIDESRTHPTMDGRSSLISVEIKHWCEPLPGVVRRIITFAGRDHKSAYAGWNRRLK